MSQPARPFSISLSPAHEKCLRNLQEKIRSSSEQIGNRSEAVQIALLGFRGDDKRVAELVKQNRQHDRRKHR